MGKCRFLYQNLIGDESMLSVNSLRPGLVSGAVKEGTGSAVMTCLGNYTGSIDREYIVQIDSVNGGSEVGQATFKWSDGSGGWNASGVLTATTPILLNNAVYVSWNFGPGADFILGDTWYFKAVNLYNAAQLINLDRDRCYRSLGLLTPNTITVDLGTGAGAVSAIILMDHNLTVNASIHLKGDPAANWSAPAYQATIPVNPAKILYYLTRTVSYRYWQLEISDPGNPDGYIEISELYLGPFVELSENFIFDYGRDRTFLQNINPTPYGIKRRRFFNLARKFKLSFQNMAPGDITALEVLLAGITNRSTARSDPFWFNENCDVPGNFWLVSAAGLSDTLKGFLRYDFSLELEEELTSV